MKILSLHIKNFGKLKDFDYTFNDGKNVILKENGFGKTTLAVFIKCMFYGIKGGNKGGLSDENERLKYLTWETTSLIGGTLDFEHDNNSYRIERYFGEKPSMDTFKIINLKTNKVEKNFTENLGEELFGVDSYGFERSTYIPQKIVEFNKKENATLSNKLASLTYGIDDGSSIDDVIIKLENESKKYYKLSGKSGYIAESKNKISNLEIKINECQTFESNANMIQTEIESVNKKIEELNFKLQNLKPKLEQAISSLAYKEEYERQMQNVEKVRARYLELKEMFYNKDINESVCNDLITLSQELIKIKGKLEALESASDNELKTYSNKFNGKMPSINDIDTHIALYDNMSSNKNNNNSFASNKTKRIYQVLASFLGVILLFVSVFCYKVNVVLGIATTIVSLIILLFGILGVLNSKNKNSTSFDEYEKEENELKKFLLNYGYDESNIKQSLLELRGDVLIYLKLLKNKEQDFNEINELKLKQQKIEKAILPFLNNFYDTINDEYFTLLTDVKTNYLEYLGLEIKLKELEKNIKEYSLKVDNNLNLNELKVLEEKINAGLSLYLTEKEKLINQKNNCEQNANLKQEYIQLLEIEKENFKKYFNKYNTISSTISFLRKAKDSLCSKYLKPITDAFLNRANKINDSEIKNISVDTDLNVNVLDNTKTRDIEYFSKGYKDIINICLRLALVDTIFTKTKPCIILDDPFINLDNKKFESVSKILDELALDYQILYLTCNTSRL